MNAKAEPGLLDQMRQVLCDPTGAVVIDGSDDDRATVAAGLEAAAELVEAARETDRTLGAGGYSTKGFYRRRLRAALAKFGGA